MGLRSLKKGTQGKTGAGPGYGVVLQVLSAEKVDDSTLKVRGFIVNNSTFGKSMEEVVLVGDEKAITNITNGGAKLHKPEASKGTILLLEGAQNKGQEDGLRSITAKYLTTISSPSKNYGDLQRGFRATTATAPVIEFPNVNHAKGEPKNISWATNTPGVSRRVKEGDEWQTKVFDRGWMAAKYHEAIEAGKKAKVYMDTFETSNAVPTSSADDIENAIRAISLRNRNGLALVRAFDADTVMVRKIPVRATKIGGEWLPDPEKTLKYFQENGYFRGIDNGALFDDIAAGGSAMEVIPGERLYYPGDSAEAIIKKNLLKPPSDSAGNPYNVMGFTFGDNAHNAAKILISGILPPEGGFVPLNMVREEPGNVHLRALPTPNNQQPATPSADTLSHDDISSGDDDNMNLGDEMSAGDDGEEFGVNTPDGGGEFGVDTPDDYSATEGPKAQKHAGSGMGM